MIVLFFVVCGFGQTTTPPPPTGTGQPNFSISGNVLGLSVNGAATPATIIGATFKVTDNVSLVSRNMLVPAFNWTGLYGGVQYVLPTTNLLKNTTLNSANFQFYANAMLGESRYSVGTNVTNHVGTWLGFGANKAVSGAFTVNIVDVGWMHAPGLGNSKNYPVVSTGLQLNWSW